MVLLAAIAIAAWAGWQLARKSGASERAAIEAQIATANARVAGKDDEIGRLCREIDKASTEVEQTRNAIAAATTARAAAEAELRLTKDNLAQATDRLTAYESERGTIIGQRDSLQKEVAMLREQNSRTEKRINEIMLSTEEKLKNATNELLKLRSRELEQNNSKAMDGIVRPLETKLKELSELVQASRDKSEENTATVREQIKNMMERTMEIGNEATRLTNALTHRSQFQGSMGEQILGNILDGAGLRQGRDYEEQVTMKSATGDTLRNTDTGQKMRPDVILHFPDEKDAIIDSKVSLTAYQAYVNAVNEADKALYLKQHIDSMRRHVDELAAKKYNDYVQKPKVTIDFVIMFVPFEGAFQAAMLNDAQLWSDALAKGVCIAGELNLTVILRMIRMAWVQFDRTQNHEEVFKAADDVVKRAGILRERIAKMGKTITTLTSDFRDCDTIVNGNQSITSGAQRLALLGAKPDKRVPSQSQMPLLDEPTPTS